MLHFALFAALLFTQASWASNFTKCHEDVKQAYKYVDGKHLYYTKYGWIFFSKEQDDRYETIQSQLGLYHFSNDDKRKPLKILKRHPKVVASITKNTLSKNRITNEGLALDRLALLEKYAHTGSAVFGACCTLRGFVSDNGVVTSEYLFRALEHKGSFATAGISFESIKGKIIVTEINPFFEFNPFKVGDEILFFDGKKRSFDTLAKEILFSKIGSKHFFKVKRKGQLEGIKIFFKERLGGGIVADTYLEHLGFSFSHDLKILAIDKKSEAAKWGLKVGDRLYSLNNTLVESDSHLRKLLQQPLEKNMRIMFERNGLAFNTYFSSDHKLTLQK